MANRDSNSDIPELYEGHRNWSLVRLVAGIVVLLIVIAFLIWFFFFRGGEVSAPSGTPPISHQAKNDRNLGGSSQSNSKSSSNSSTSRSGQDKLTNTGPGDVVAVFMGAVIVGALTYNFKLRRSTGRQ